MGLPRKFGRFRQALTELSRVPSDVARASARAIQRDMRRNFARGVDPYGRPYLPLAPASLARGRRPPPLRAYAKAVTAQPMQAAGISLRVDHPQAGFHQTGTRYMPKRIVIPDRGVPPKWTAIIEDEMARAVRRRMRGAA